MGTNGLCCSKKHPYPPPTHTCAEGIFYLNSHPSLASYFPLKILEFPMAFLGLGICNFWNLTSLQLTDVGGCLQIIRIGSVCFCGGGKRGELGEKPLEQGQ